MQAGPPYAHQLESVRSQLHPPAKLSRISCSFHLPIIGSISSLTLVSKHDLLIVTSFPVEPLGNHGSSHIFTFSPLPIRHIIHSFSSSAPLKLLLQVYDMPARWTQWRISEFGKYLAISTCPHSVSGLVSSLHACLLNIAKLNKCKSRNSSPPFFFDLVSFFPTKPMNFICVVLLTPPVSRNNHI